ERVVTDAGAEPSDAATDLDAAPSKPDAGRVPQTTTPVDASLDIQFLVIATVLEMERSLTARCPCLTVAGEYDSTSECLSAVSLGRHWIDCASRVDLSAQDSAETRENLRCNIAQLSLRSECLMGSSCAADAIAACMTQSLDCAEIPYELISQVVSECKITLSR
ncbi:MAG TPA: hypothetical protein VMF89_28810, partial [Polyangiales bacterium]|nr:hypothetical protein [Polyangiales bacterium]